jgi:uncharacterized transporter YbjL
VTPGETMEFEQHAADGWRVRDLVLDAELRPFGLGLAFAFVGLAYGGHVFATTVATTAEWVVTTTAIAVVAIAFLAVLDWVVCLLTESHDCRHCSKEDERWEVAE